MAYKRQLNQIEHKYLHPDVGDNEAKDETQKNARKGPTHLASTHERRY
ncbi:MAG: hypothetical protein ACREOZ_00725 [Gloeomargaritales cyanobacterium]